MLTEDTRLLSQRQRTLLVAAKGIMGVALWLYQCPSPTGQHEGPNGACICRAVGHKGELKLKESVACMTSSKQACRSGKRSGVIQEL